MRTLATAARAVVLAVLVAAPASATNSLIGNWSSKLNWENQQTGLYSVLTIAGNGHVRVHVMNHMGMAYDLFGTYRMDATGRTMHFV